ncbi:uncharacterized protein TNCV_1848821 [Trichonephila clavipes]|nr:uncharacterized protein TNCV_1848821 [Trichonephila clavipes]
MAALVSEYTLEFFTLLNARGKKELIEWCMKEGLIASSYECPKCNEQMGLNERKSVVLDGFEWRCRKKVRTHERTRCRKVASSSPVATEDPPYKWVRGSVSTFWCGVVRKGSLAQVSSSLLDRGSKLEVRPNSPSSTTLI